MFYTNVFPQKQRIRLRERRPRRRYFRPLPLFFSLVFALFIGRFHHRGFFSGYLSEGLFVVCLVSVDSILGPLEGFAVSVDSELWSPEGGVAPMVAGVWVRTTDVCDAVPDECAWAP